MRSRLSSTFRQTLSAIWQVRGRICLVVCILFIAACPPKARGDSYTYGTLDFTVTSGSPAPTGSFILDNTTDTFGSFTVNWDGATYNFSGVLGSAIALSGYWCAEGPFYSSSIACLQNLGTFAFANQLSNGLPAPAFVGASTGPFTELSAFAYGSYTTTETAVPTPEPSSLALIMLGLVAFSLSTARKSMSRGRLSWMGWV